MQLYKTKKLIENGVNFSAIYSNKQEQVKDLTGFDFNLSNIVSFLKKQTNDFTVQIPLAFDIDAQIYSIYMKWVDATDTKPTPSEKPKAEAPSEAGEKPTKEVLQTRLKLVKKMNDKNPSALLKTRMKIIEKQLKEA
jgi:hypothetical protein